MVCCVWYVMCCDYVVIILIYARSFQFQRSRWQMITVTDKDKCKDVSARILDWHEFVCVCVYMSAVVPKKNKYEI